MIDWTAIGALILRAREAKGWSQAELGRRAGLTGSVIGFIERVERDSYQPETIERLAAALGLNFTFELSERPAVTEDATVLEERRKRDELHRELASLLEEVEPDDAAWALGFLRRQAAARRRAAS